MRGALIGFGNVALAHLSAYAQVKDLSVGAVVDPVAARRELASKIIPDIHTYSNTEEMFGDQSNGQLDFVDICSPPDSHYRHIRSGLINDCHVLCEKPLLLQLEQYPELLALSNLKHKLVYPCHNYKFSPMIQLVSETAASGKLGRLALGHFRTLRNGHAKGVSDWNPNWRRDSRIAGGGILYDHGYHSIYLACHLTAKQPQSVSCVLGNSKGNDYYGTEDTVWLTINFGDMKCLIDLCWGANVRRTYYSLVGTKGTITIEDDTIQQTTIDGKLSKIAPSSETDGFSYRSWLRPMFNDFKYSMGHDGLQYQLLLESLMALLIIKKAYDSAASGGHWLEIPSAKSILVN